MYVRVRIAAWLVLTHRLWIMSANAAMYFSVFNKIHLRMRDWFTIHTSLPLCYSDQFGGQKAKGVLHSVLVSPLRPSVPSRKLQAIALHRAQHAAQSALHILPLVNCILLHAAFLTPEDFAMAF